MNPRNEAQAARLDVTYVQIQKLIDENSDVGFVYSALVHLRRDVAREIGRLRELDEEARFNELANQPKTR